MEYVPEPLRWSTFSENVIRHSSSQVSTPTLGSEAEIVHIGRRSQNKCAVIMVIGARSQKALWDSHAGRCIISYDCYNSLHTKYKTELFPSSVKIGLLMEHLSLIGENVMSSSKSTRRDSHSLSFVWSNCPSK